MTALAPTSNAYVAISRRTLDMEDYIDVARRHVVWILGPLFAGVVLSIVVAFVQSNIYVSSAEMQITPAQISESIVKTTINQQLTERIMTMENEILSRTSLSNIIQAPNLNLYKSERANKPLEDVIETMRTRDIHIQINTLPGERRASAFSISFAYPDRLLAQQTVQALITRFTEANLTSQRNQQNMVNTYVHDELSEAKAKLDRFEEELTKFRVENSGKLPEQSNLNMAQLASLQQQSNAINDALNRLAQQRVQYDTHLQTLQGNLELYNMMDKETIAPLPAPLIRQQNERLVQLNRTILDTETQLAQLRQVYTSSYPDIRDSENRLEVLRKQRDELQKAQDDELAIPKPEIKEAPKKTNFQSAQTISAIQGQIDAARAALKAHEMEVANRQKEQLNVNKQIEAYQTRLAATSGIEAKYADMVRESQSAREHYQVLQTQQQLTEANGQVLDRKGGENLDVLDPPSLPVQPTKPNRWLIMGAGTAISFILGICLAGVQEAKDTSLKNLKDVRAYTNLPVLSSIPLLENTMLVRRKRRISYLAWSAAVIIGILAVSASLYYHYTYAL